MTLPTVRPEELEQLMRAGAVRLEITAGVPTWEALPGFRHQRIIDRIRATIAPRPGAKDGCACVHASDVLIRFPDSSFKRPDIALFCEEPPDQDEALTIVPAAVIEIISRGYEYKDVTLNPPFYLSQGVQDVVIVDPDAQRVTHYTVASVANHYAPVQLTFVCGCECTIHV